MLRLSDHWIWDSWIAVDRDVYHLFFLQAPRELGDPKLRHLAAAIGHATSTNLRDWEYHGLALPAGPPGSWDDLALWTGSTVRGDDGIWRLYYTALSSRGGHGAASQKIGLAESTDLMTWHRVGDQPLVQAGPRWYATLGDPDDPRASQTWRDPFVFRDPDGDGWHMYLCARVPHAPRLMVTRNGFLAGTTGPNRGDGSGAAHPA